MDDNNNNLMNSLELKSNQRKDFIKGTEILKKIIEDFDSISVKINYNLSTKKYKELIKLNSESFENNILRGFNQSAYNYSYIREINKQKILQEFKERNLVNWKSINELGFIARAIISYGVSKRRKAIPVFLNDKELKMYGYYTGLDIAPDYNKIYGDSMYYDKYEYPVEIGTISNKKWWGIKFTRGMRNQCKYLNKHFFNKIFNEKKLKYEEYAISLYKNPKLLELIFESLRKLKNSNQEKIDELDNKLLMVYDELVSTKDELLRGKSKIEIKEFFEHDVKLVKQNYNIYPIILNYVAYIKKEILEANHRKSTLKEVFLYISKNITNGFIKPTAIKKYYYDKYLDLIKK
jgi:hypothetical protein